MNHIIYERDDNQGGQPRLRYYKHTFNGRPIFGPKADAAGLSGAMLESVVRQLQQLRPSWEIGTLKVGENMARKTKPVAGDAPA